MSSPALAQESTRRADRELAQAERAAERGQLSRAWRIWLRLAQRAPADPRAAIRLASALPREPLAAAAPDASVIARAREVEAALDAHLEATGEGADHGPARARAWAVAVAGDHARAIEAASGLVGLQDAESAALLSRLAALAVHRGDLSAAHRALEAAHRALPQDSGVLSDLGAVELALGDPERARGRYSRILARRPDDVGASRDLAGALVAAGRGAEAVALLTRAVREHPELAELRIELARAALEAGQANVAERAARGAITSLAADDARGHTILGAALAAQRRRSEAELAFAEALRRDPRDVQARQGLEALRSERAQPAP